MIYGTLKSNMKMFSARKMSQRYSGQALAIVLVLLVVGSIIGLALYARSLKDTGRVTQEKGSAEANELAETIIGILSTTDYQKIMQTCRDGEVDYLADPDGCKPSGDTLQDVENFLNEVGAATDGSILNNFVGTDATTPKCESADLSLSYATQDDKIPVQKDQAVSIFVPGINWAACSITFNMEPTSPNVGFLMSRNYATVDANGKVTSFLPYNPANVESFCFSADGSSCENLNFLGSSWLPYIYGTEAGNTRLTFPSGLYATTISAKPIYEVRFRSINGDSNLSWTTSGDCSGLSNFIISEVGSTCQGEYVGKTFLIPPSPSAPPIFDYTIFNGKGVLEH